MKREEAIERLEFLKGVYSVDMETALDMAIEALKETPTNQEKHQLSTKTSTKTPTDLISRADAIEAVRNICNTPCNEYFVNALKELPSAETHEIRTETHGVCSNLTKDGEAECITT